MGTLASVGGGLFMGLTIAVTLIAQSTACRVQWQDILFPLLLWGAFAGGFGSLV